MHGAGRGAACARVWRIQGSGHMAPEESHPGRRRSDPLLSFPSEQRRPTLMDWLRAWREVVRDPDKQIPSLPMPAEGVPIPESFDLHCPECGYNLTGLREWRCPECGERFSPRRAYTLRLLRTPEFVLRYRYGPDEIRSILYSVILSVGSLVLLLMAGLRMIALTGMTLIAFFGVIVLPNMVLLRWQAGLSWPRLFFWMSLLFFLVVAGITLAAWL